MIFPLQTFSVGNLTFKDLASIEDRVQAGIYAAKGRNNLRTLIARSRETVICGVECKATQLITEAWLDAKKRNPELTYEEFISRLDLEFDNTVWDDRLETIALGMWEGRTFIGVFFLYNIKTITEDRDSIQVSAYPAPGFIFVDNSNWVNNMNRILSLFLDLELTMIDGRKFDLVEWQFPTDRSDQSWTSGSEQWAIDLMAALTANTNFTVETKDGSIRTLKKKTNIRP
jgi:hypothetical protein